MNYFLIPTPNIRVYYEDTLADLLTEQKQGPNPEGTWQRLFLQKLHLKRTQLEAALLHYDPAYPSESARARAFAQMGHGCERTYINHAKKLRHVSKEAHERALKALAEAEREIERLATAIRPATAMEVMDLVIEKGRQEDQAEAE